MLELYHAGLSTASQKVRLALEERGLAWQGHEIDLMAGEQHSEDYRALNPDGTVPTLLHDGGVVHEATLINEYLEDAFRERPLRPAHPAERARMRRWPKWVDDSLQVSAGVLVHGIALRPLVLRRFDGDVERALAPITHREIRTWRRSVLLLGLDAPEVREAVVGFDELLERMNAALAHGPWLCGERYTLADVGLLPFVYRLENLALERLWSAGRRPLVADWLERAKARRGFQRAIVDWAPEPALAMFRKAGEVAWPKLAQHVPGGL
jgi:glutathione S-transferase